MGPPQDEAPGAGAWGSCTGRLADMSSTDDGHLLLVSETRGQHRRRRGRRGRRGAGRRAGPCAPPPDELDARARPARRPHARHRRRRRQPAPRGHELHRAGSWRDAASRSCRSAPATTWPARSRSRSTRPRRPASSATARPRPLDLLSTTPAASSSTPCTSASARTPPSTPGALKPRLGPLAYPLGAVRAGLRSTGWRLRVEVDGRLLVRRPPAHAHGRHRQRPRHRRRHAPAAARPGRRRPARRHGLQGDRAVRAGALRRRADVRRRTCRTAGALRPRRARSPSPASRSA